MAGPACPGAGFVVVIENVPGRSRSGHGFAGAQERSCVDSEGTVRWSDWLGEPGSSSTSPARPFAKQSLGRPKGQRFSASTGARTVSPHETISRAGFCIGDLGGRLRDRRQRRPKLAAQQRSGGSASARRSKRRTPPWDGSEAIGSGGWTQGLRPMLRTRSNTLYLFAQPSGTPDI